VKLWNRIELAWLALARTANYAQTMLSVGDLGPKHARNATPILLREMQRCTDKL
jgi:hypothetical protein